MCIFFLVLCVIPALPCVHSQMSLSLSGPLLVRPSETLRLTCKVTGVPITDGSKIHSADWARQRTGDTLVFLAHLNHAQGSAFNPTLRSRLSLSRDTTRNEVYLGMTGMEVEDTATYYCTKSHSDVTSNKYCCCIAWLYPRRIHL
ncbi:hypothetical protein FKM82_021028 [Ascaphus truei]